MFSYHMSVCVGTATEGHWLMGQDSSAVVYSSAAVVYNVDKRVCHNVMLGPPYSGSNSISGYRWPSSMIM